ncbi:MAG: SMC-Scp complex subunit ScpB [Planctomycetaceae bacterium]
MLDRNPVGLQNLRSLQPRYYTTGTTRAERENMLMRASTGGRRSSGSGLLQADGSLIRTVRIARLEAALLIAEGAVPARKLAQSARLIDGREVQQLVATLNESYDRTRSAFRIEQTAAGYIMMTRAALAPWLDRLHNRQAAARLSPPMMETLTIIAYQQPVTRADVEAIRGVQSAEMIRQLLDKGLIRIAGEDDSLGRPFLYGTTKLFLTTWALRQLEDLPGYETLKKPGKNSEPALLPFPEDDEAAA